MTSPTESSARSRREAFRVSALAATTGLLMVHRKASATGAGTQDKPGSEVKPRPEDVGSLEVIVKASMTRSRGRPAHATGVAFAACSYPGPD